MDGGLNGGGVILYYFECIYVLEIYLEEYLGFYVYSYLWNLEVFDCGSIFLEVVNDFDFWIIEILEDNFDYGVFLLGGCVV